MIYTDGVVFTTDGAIAELSAFAKQCDIPAHCMRMYRGLVCYEVIDAGGRERIRRAGAQWVRNRQALRDIWAARSATPKK